MKNYNNICAVLVTYRYHYNNLAPLLLTLTNQVGKIFIIDNNDAGNPYELHNIEVQFKNCRIIKNGRNVGLAGGLNRGLEAALKDGCYYFLLLDQDSIPSKSMVRELMNAFSSLKRIGRKVAAVGASVFDRNRKEYLPFLRFSYLGVEKTHPEVQADISPIQTDFLITSGSLIGRDVLNAAGLMEEELFIDNVDLEWCFRSRRVGFRLFGVPGATLYHCLGDDIRRTPFAGRPFLIHSPLREYYIMRNRLWLYRRRYVPLSWKIHDFPRILFKALLYPVMVRPIRPYVKMMCRGFVDGVRGK